MGCTVCITDTDQVVASAGSGKKDLQEQFIGQELGEALKERSQILAKNGDVSYIKVTAEMIDYYDEVICPIICEGDVIGAVVLLSRDEKRRFGEVEQRVAYSAADFLGRQMA